MKLQPKHLHDDPRMEEVIRVCPEERLRLVKHHLRVAVYDATRQLADLEPFRYYIDVAQRVPRNAMLPSHTTCGGHNIIQYVRREIVLQPLSRVPAIIEGLRRLSQKDFADELAGRVEEWKREQARIFGECPGTFPESRIGRLALLREIVPKIDNLLEAMHIELQRIDSALATLK